MNEVVEKEPAPARRGWARRAGEWLWRGQALRRAKAESVAALDAIAHQRARIAAEVGEQALDPPGPWRAGRADHLAAALFVESIGWSLRAARQPSDIPPSPDAKLDVPSSRAELDQAMDVQQELLPSACEGRDVLARPRRYVTDRAFESTSAATDDVEIAARTLQRVAHNLVALTERSRPQMSRLLLQRVTRSGGLLLLLIATVLAATMGRDFLERRADLSVNKPWSASSSYEVACQSPKRHCNDKDYFFHTQEEPNPWLELDLQRRERISGVRVINRRDCCAERAVPLVVELSSDHETWREVARRDEPFASWRASFAPQEARWVRLRVARRSLLHLSDVRVLP